MNNRHRMIVRARKRYGLYHIRVKFDFNDEFSKALYDAFARVTDSLRELMVSANEAAKSFDWSEIAKQLGGKS